MPIYSNSEVHTQRSAVTGLNDADWVTLAHGIALTDGCDDGLVTREHTATVVDRENGAIDDGSREMHDAVGWREDCASGRADVDAAVPRCIRSRGRDEGPKY